MDLKEPYRWYFQMLKREIQFLKTKPEPIEIPQNVDRQLIYNHSGLNIESSVLKQKNIIEDFLSTQEIFITIHRITITDTITFEFYPKSYGLKLLTKFDKDLQLHLKVENCSILSPYKDNGTVAIQIPLNAQLVYKYADLTLKSGLEIPIGKSNGKDIFSDLSKMPHLLVHGKSQSGKTNFLYTSLMSLLENNIQVCIIDRKSQFSKFKKIVSEFAATDEEVISLLNQLIEVMEERYSDFDKHEVYNLKEYNQKISDDRGPIVLVIDELANVMKDKKTIPLFVKLSSMAAGCGIHIIAATQHASSDVVSTEIKTNFGGRLTFKVDNVQTSNMIIGSAGAEHLTKKGEAYFYFDKLIKVQTYLVEDSDIERVRQAYNHV